MSTKTLPDTRSPKGGGSWGFLLMVLVRMSAKIRNLCFITLFWGSRSPSSTIEFESAASFVEGIAGWNVKTEELFFAGAGVFRYFTLRLTGKVRKHCIGAGGAVARVVLLYFKLGLRNILGNFSFNYSIKKKITVYLLFCFCFKFKRITQETHIPEKEIWNNISIGIIHSKIKSVIQRRIKGLDVLLWMKGYVILRPEICKKCVILIVS